MARNIIETIPYDKLLHVLLGTVVFMLSNIMLRVLQVENPRCTSLMITIVAGVLIELYQIILDKGKFEMWDIIAVAIGGATGFFTDGE